VQAALQLPRQGRLPDPAHAVEDQHITPRRHQILRIGHPAADEPPMRLERPVEGGPLVVAVGEDPHRVQID
jgi:hypothetical protein